MTRGEWDTGPGVYRVLNKEEQGDIRFLSTPTKNRNVRRPMQMGRTEGRHGVKTGDWRTPTRDIQKIQNQPDFRLHF